MSDHWRRAVQDDGALSVMCAYNLINGDKCAENKFLIRTVLRDLWGFQGYTMSDWDGFWSTEKAMATELDFCEGAELYTKVVPPLNLLYVGWNEPGEWFNLTVVTTEAGSYVADILYTAHNDARISFSADGGPAVPCGITSTFDAADEIPWRQWHHWNVQSDSVTLKLPKGVSVIKILNVYSFLELLNANIKDKSQGIDLFGVCDFCAKHNFDAVDLTGYFFPGYPGVPDDKYIISLKRHAFNLGLGISGTGVRNDFTTADESIRFEGVQRIKDSIEVAAKLGAPTVRAFADSQPPFKNWQEASGNATRERVEEWMAADLLECAKHGEKFGIIVAVQNHGDFINTGAEH